MKHLSIFFFFLSTLCSLDVNAQNPVSYDDLNADFYENEGKTAVLLLHGTLAHNRMEIVSTIAALLAEDFGVPVLAPNLSFNLPDREGMLDCGITHTHKHFDALREIAEWVQYLKLEKGFEQIVISGHSRGGAQISAYLADQPDPAVKGAILIAPAIYDAQNQATNYKNQYGVELINLVAKAKKLKPDTVMEVPGFVYCQTAKVTAGSFLSYYSPDSRLDTPTNLAKVNTIPITVIAGSEDNVVASLPNKIKGNVDIGENIRVETIDGADHFFRDLYADDVALLFSDLIEGLE